MGHVWTGLRDLRSRLAGHPIFNIPEQGQIQGPRVCSTLAPVGNGFRFCDIPHKPTPSGSAGLTTPMLPKGRCGVMFRQCRLPPWGRKIPTLTHGSQKLKSSSILRAFSYIFTNNTILIMNKYIKYHFFNTQNKTTFNYVISILLTQ